MRRRYCSVLVLPAVLVSLLVVGGSVSAQELPEAYGGDLQWTVLHNTGWVSLGASSSYPLGYVGPAAPDSAFTSQLDLPVGAQVEQVRYMVYDADSSGYWRGNLAAFEAGDVDAVPVIQGLAGTAGSGPGTPGYSSIGGGVQGFVIRAIADLNGDGFDHEVAYVLTADALGSPSDLANMRFWGASVGWRRTVSPAPVAPSFDDVPVSHWAFRFVEALADSGITAGCGGGDYCPDQPITRAEVAVFLSSALGLHWTQ